MPQITLDDSPVSSATIKVPKYRRHKASGQAVVTLAGRDFYLGAYGSPASRAEYKRLIGEYLAGHGAPPRTTGAAAAGAKLIAFLVDAYWMHCKATYPGATWKGTMKPALRRLNLMYGPVRIDEFGPKALKAFRQSLLDERKGGRRLSRPYVNRVIKEVRRCFKWGVSEELVPASVLHALQAVEGLRRGSTDAPEPGPVRAVPDAHIETVLPHLPEVLADMVRLQWLTGARPGEVCVMTAAQIDTSGKAWVYTPLHHKTEHHGKERHIVIGPRAQEIVRRYLQPDLGAALFSPGDSERRRMAELRAENQTPFTPSRRKRDARCAAKPKRRFRDRYTTTSYGIAVRRACEAAGVPGWSPNQLRHSRATEIRKTYGLDGAGAVLGHSKLETTQIYAEKNLALAEQIALQTG